jgi:hypothetical protein
LPILFKFFSPIRPIASPILFANWRQFANRPIGGQSPTGQKVPIGRNLPIGPIYFNPFLCIKMTNLSITCRIWY